MITGIGDRHLVSHHHILIGVTSANGDTPDDIRWDETRWVELSLVTSLRFL